MSVDLHLLENGACGKHLCSLDDVTFELLRPGLSLFTKRTGLTIDQYGDLKLSSGCQSLITALSDASMTADDTAQKNALLSLVSLLTNEQANDHGVIFVGD